MQAHTVHRSCHIREVGVTNKMDLLVLGHLTFYKSAVTNYDEDVHSVLPFEFNPTGNCFIKDVPCHGIQQWIIHVCLFDWAKRKMNRISYIVNRSRCEWETAPKSHSPRTSMCKIVICNKRARSKFHPKRKPLCNWMAIQCRKCAEKQLLFESMWSEQLNKSST